METDRWKQIEDLFHAVLAEPPEKRAEFVARACPDPALRDEVLSLLKAAHEDSSFLVASPVPPEGPAPQATQTLGAGESAGTVIGRYHLLERIGEGGMGEVWLAEQREPVRRRVALKLIKAGMNTREVIARFESERQALALMDHPAIARVFDAGSTPQGAPYFVMEYVPGLPITAYCDHHRLSTRERLELFAHVCAGIQHAHQKAIIHRDLKPSNILVTEVDGRAAPKIIDFGVAKALTQKLTADTLFTRLGALVGTPEYMSPEQANSSGEDIDTRTDVYSLGIIFYELLAGVPPIELRRVALDEFLRRLREEEPSKPSTKIRTQDPATSSEVARKRQTEPLSLAKQLRGDLDSIALKALEKDRARRYGSPADFAADIERYLKNEAVLAVPASASYRARKFARRHRGALATAGAVAVVLAVAAGVSIWQSVRAMKQRDRADREAATAQAINNFLQNDLLAQASSDNQIGLGAKPDPDLKVRTALDRAAARIAGRFHRQPEVEASIRDTIGQAYSDLGLEAEAQKEWELALNLHRRMLGAEDPKTIRTISRLGNAADLRSDGSRAEALASQALRIQRRVLGPEHPDTLYSMSVLARARFLLGKSEEAESLEKQVLDIRRRVLGPEHSDTLAAMYNLGIFYRMEGKLDQAEPIDYQTLEMRRRTLGPDHPATLNSMNELAGVYDAQGKSDKAEALTREALDIKRHVLGPEHPNVMTSTVNLAVMLHADGKDLEAEPLFRQTVEIWRRALGAEHPNTLYAMNWLAVIYAGQGKYNLAEPLFRETLELKRRVMGIDDSQTLVTQLAMAFMYQRWGKYASAEALASQALDLRRRAGGPDDPWAISAAFYLALADESQGKFTQSETLSREALTYYKKKSPNDPFRFRSEVLLGASLSGQKKFAEAEPLLMEGYRGLEHNGGMPAAQRYHLDRARGWLIRLYENWGKPEKAAEWRKKQ